MQDWRDVYKQGLAESKMKNQETIIDLIKEKTKLLDRLETVQDAETLQEEARHYRDMLTKMNEMANCATVGDDSIEINCFLDTFFSSAIKELDQLCNALDIYYENVENEREYDAHIKAESSWNTFV